MSYVDRALRTLQEFLRLEAAGGLLLMAATVLAMAVANSPAHGIYKAVLDRPLGIGVGTLRIDKPLLLWINDGLMAVFFLLVGLELKREMYEGHLSSLRRASLPAVAALGGLLTPAVIYAALNWHDPTALRGWAMPAATDIAFALGVLSLLGDRVPTALKAFLLSVAIFDDLGAIVIIALFYTAKVSLLALAIAAICVLALAWLNHAGVVRLAPYVLIGIPLWVAVLKSGVHATLAGVVLALFIPLRGESSSTVESSLHRLEHALHPWVAFGILPFFAFANAGVRLTGLSIADLLHPVPLGVIVGLFAGKQVGIIAACTVSVRLGIASLPQDVRWSQLYGITLLCGIGFTMSLFIASLAFEEGAVGMAGLERLGIVVGSLIAGLGGYIALRFFIDGRADAGSPP